VLPNITFFFFNYKLQQTEDVEDEKSLDILQDPTRIFSGDKPSSQFFPKNGKVLAYTGDKNMCQVDRCHAKASITVVLPFLLLE
jgi:hypothetical protein